MKEYTIARNFLYIKKSFEASKRSKIFLVLGQILCSSIPAFQAKLISMILELTRVTIKKSLDLKIVFLVLFLGLILLIDFLIKNFSESYQIVLREKIAIHHQFSLIKSIHNLKYQEIETPDMQDQIEHVASDYASKIQQGFVNIISLLGIILTILSLAYLIVLSSYLIALLYVVFLIPIIAIAKKSGIEAHELSKNVAQLNRKAKYYRTLLIAKENSKERNFFGYGNKIREQWEKTINEKNKIDFKSDIQIFVRAKTLSISFAISAIIISIPLIIGLSMRKININSFIALFISLSSFVHMLSWNLGGLLKDFIQYNLFVVDMQALIKKSINSLIINVEGKKIDVDTHFNVTFSKVSFAYDTGNDVLHDIDLTFSKGKQYAIVGQNGSGKSTLIKLLAGLYEKYSGEICINGINIRELDHITRREIMTFIFQEVPKYQMRLNELFNGKENVPASILDMLKKIEPEFVVNGVLNTEIAIGKIFDNGIEVSEEQWQKIAIARALNKNPNLFVFDEPAACLDAISESEMFFEIKEKSKEKGITTIYIKHRVSTAKYADEIIVLEYGKVIENGKHNELINNSKVYRNMFEKQKQWYMEKGVEL